ncbi:MAG: hypothetical protein EFKGCFLK_01963 [Rhodocyclaceae bacterium]|nr:MAG: type IV pilus modification protein PilV [Rhodocyclaceae bacterium]MBV6408376.1 hypothetical protein [Rhodocyclaceae bacterium]CAG0929774.1 hypothetical protein RHDC3_01316 [Rhodocyclaceae bacterium]
MRHKPIAQRGVSLIEVLVTLVILAFGMLGIAGLIIKGNRAAYEAYQRHQALAIANDMAERIKANQAMLLTGGSNVTMLNTYVGLAPVAMPIGDPGNPVLWNALQTATITDCNAATCDRVQLSSFDVALWEGELLGVSETATVGGQRLGGLINARGCIEGPLAAPSPPNTYRISVAWQGDVPTIAPGASICARDLNIYVDAAGNLNDATRRLISLDITVFEPI